jgi:hypothetical protein
VGIARLHAMIAARDVTASLSAVEIIEELRAGEQSLLARRYWKAEPVVIRALHQRGVLADQVRVRDLHVSGIHPHPATGATSSTFRAGRWTPSATSPRISRFSTMSASPS